MYRFDDFQLDPLARELSRDGRAVSLPASAFDCLVYLVEHRERAIGRDELISAVWGRVDVSDNRLAQTIVRLRRALGDAGSEQRYIRTVARVGYRWMPDTTSTERMPTPSVGAFETAPGTDDDTQAPPEHAEARGYWRGAGRRRLYLVTLVLFLPLAGYLGWHLSRTARAPASLHLGRRVAIVLPATVQAPEDWQWLRYGLMELVSNRLRDAKMLTEPSSSTMSLVRQQAGGHGQVAPWLPGFGLQVRPDVAYSGDTWHVRLKARGHDGGTWATSASSGNVLVAARTASELLLAQMGYGGSAAESPSDDTQDALQRIDAARLAGQPETARELINRAPPKIRNQPEVAYALASLDCEEGHASLCEARLLALLKRLPGGRDPYVQGEIFTSLGLLYGSQGQHGRAKASLDRAVAILRSHKGGEALANAYLDRAYEEQVLTKFDDASADLGLARITYILSGDALGAAKVDFELGLLKIRRNQPDAALALLQRARGQFESMGARAMLPTALDGIADVQQIQLQFADELRTSDLFWPLGAHDLGFISAHMRYELTLARASALADNGRTAEAEGLADRLIVQADSSVDATLIAETDELLAVIDLEQGHDMQAARTAAKVLVSDFVLVDPEDCAHAYFVRIEALLHANRLQDAQRQLDEMSRWAARLRTLNAWVSLYLARAQASRSWAMGDRATALDHLKHAMDVAEKMGVPEGIVQVGAPYTLALLATGHVHRAMAVGGVLSAWSATDWRAAWAEACLYGALGHRTAEQQATRRAKRLAGDRSLPMAGTSFIL
ncbi:winged helix-turn-helix domain-containing protein [Dyella sp. A6]|uniref:winged helix-turn-helix domain-containing protein n=1 Tax=Dyella aluminiiresistens TaxID=3069105 RepID=UPI002E77A679|nr:winged helix-turn-helix domain-containing protein [Dyella sp. A6]